MKPSPFSAGKIKHASVRVSVGVTATVWVGLNFFPARVSQRKTFLARATTAKSAHPMGGGVERLKTEALL